MHHNAPPGAVLGSLFILVALLALGALYMRRKGYSGVGGDHVIVRCRTGHLFTTIWIPGISLKAVRLGPVRFQYCPIGDHWAFVDIVNEVDLTDAERHFAATHHDSRIP